jgi:DNA gyrase/topoisomerase IV subunit A
MSTVKKTISEIIDDEYLAFAMYTLEARAIPSAIDGMKPVHRKLIYAMLNEHKDKKVKMNDLGSISKFNYHHGEVSATDAAIAMAASWKNNAPLFTGHGNFGSRLVQEAAGPRYIYATLSKVFEKVFIDSEVTIPSFDVENPEPAFYLPIIPWILINGISGMAVGFKTEVLPRSIKDVTDAVKACIGDRDLFVQKNKPIIPTFPHFTGTTEQISENQYKTKGMIKYTGRNLYEISELPIGYSREKYIIHLNEMLDKELIRDYDDLCSKSGFGFKIKVSLAQKEVIDKDPIKYFALEKTHTEILTTLGIDGRLKIFDSVAQLIAYFVDYRLTKFNDKISYDIREQKRSLEIASDRIKFIQAVINNKIDLRTTSRAGLLQFIGTHITAEEHGKQFAGIPLYSCTNDAVDELLVKIQSYKDEISRLEKMNAVDLFKDKLKTIK